MVVDVPQNISVIRVKESWEGDEFSSLQAASCCYLSLPSPRQTLSEQSWSGEGKLL